MLHFTRFEHLDVTLLCTTYLYNIHFCVVLPCLYLLKDDQLKQFGTLAKTCKWKTTNIQFCLTFWEPNKTHFHQCNIIKTILKSCKYQPNCKSTQNALDTKHWKGCENRDLAAEKRVKISGVIAGGVTLFWFASVAGDAGTMFDHFRRGFVLKSLETQTGASESNSRVTAVNPLCLHCHVQACWSRRLNCENFMRKWILWSTFGHLANGK